jgi:hypothetical protein
MTDRFIMVFYPSCRAEARGLSLCGLAIGQWLPQPTPMLAGRRHSEGPHCAVTSAHFGHFFIQLAPFSVQSYLVREDRLSLMGESRCKGAMWPVYGTAGGGGSLHQGATDFGS